MSQIYRGHIDIHTYIYIYIYIYIYRSGKRPQNDDESVSCSETLSKSGLSLPLHAPTTRPLVCYSAGRAKPMPGECTAGVRYTRTNVVCSLGPPVHFQSDVKCTHMAQKVHGKSCHGHDICFTMENK